MSDYHKGLYVLQLSEERQEIIKSELYQVGLEYDEIEIAMSSRLCDLTDTINIANILQLN